jgi:hypothetical protein
MGNNKERRGSCVNCLHCKRSKYSTPINILAFCKKKKGLQEERNIEYWETRKICKSFDDMEVE